MRADRVKPGMLVRRLDSPWMVVTGLYEAAFTGWRIPLANGAFMPVMPGADIEAVRLTDAQKLALRTVSKDGLYRLTDKRTDTISWWAYGERTGSPVPLARIAELGLIRPDPDTPRESWQDKSYDYFTLSPSGRALLDLLDKEPSDAR